MYIGRKLQTNKIIVYNELFDFVQDYFRIVFEKTELNIKKTLVPFSYCATNHYVFVFNEVESQDEDLLNGKIDLNADGEWICTIQTSNDGVLWVDVYKDIYFQEITETLQTIQY